MVRLLKILIASGVDLLGVRKAKNGCNALGSQERIRGLKAKPKTKEQAKANDGDKCGKGIKKPDFEATQIQT